MGPASEKKSISRKSLERIQVQLMKIAKVIDPLNIMNPGKVRMQQLSFSQSFFRWLSWVSKLYPDKAKAERQER